MWHLLDRERTVARPGFNRWLVPPAALAIHLSIGMAYGFSVFWLPLSRLVGSPCAAELGILARLTATDCDWDISTLGWMYTLFFVFLGSSAAVFGHWLEREGPRKAGVVAACCWGGGFFISALGIHLHQAVLLLVGSGVIGGCGLGLGYISPVSTLIKWFPDRRGMATGMAIMGFGGGAMIGAPLADWLMGFWRTADSAGVTETFLTLGTLYFVAMLVGAFGYRVPPRGWRPEGFLPATGGTGRMITTRNVHLDVAHRTPQFWLLWAVLCLNVSAGIGVIGVASPMLQEVFGGRLIGADGVGFEALDAGQAQAVAAVAAGFTGLLSLFNIVGRFAWASCSDWLGRKLTYATFFALGAALYALAPGAGAIGHVPLFVGIFCLILTMYGGGFATIPAYLADIFGTQYVGAIHGRLLTAWSTAGVIGPTLVNYMREYLLAQGLPRTEAYGATLYILAGLLVAGFCCNLLVRPVAERHYLREEASSAPGGTRPLTEDPVVGWAPAPSTWPRVYLAWAAVAVPLGYGIWNTLAKTAALFGG